MFFMNRNMRSSYNTRDRGVTLLEVIVVSAIMILLATFIVGIFSRYRDEQVLNAEISAVAALLNEARSQTLSSYEGSEYSVHFEAARAVLFKGLTFTEPSTYNKEVTLNPAVTLSSIIINGGGNNITFERLTGEATTTYGTTTVSLTLDSSKKRDVVVSRSGNISVK